MNAQDGSESPQRRRRNLYGRRKGPALSAHQESLRATLLPSLLLRPEMGKDPRAYFSPPPLRDFGDVSEVWLEVGYGAGEHLLWQAQHHPRIGLIGAEPYIAGTAKLLSRLEQQPAENVRLYEDDARDIIDALPDASIGRFFLLFPDPWPKTRHHKRRFVQMPMLDALARILKPGAELRFASDDAGYLAHALERLMAHAAFAWTATGPSDWKARPADWPPTRYEAKELHGPPAFLRFVRTDKIAA
ncbi:MAG: tRNA (guanine(46)-N(7))-methyltransferase TrmB [Rhizomicrobium sp.]